MLHFFFHRRRSFFVESCDTLKTSRAKQNTQLNTKSLINIEEGKGEAQIHTNTKKREKKYRKRNKTQTVRSKCRTILYKINNCKPLPDA